jgi:hypothetical protein
MGLTDFFKKMGVEKTAEEKPDEILFQKLQWLIVGI